MTINQQAFILLAIVVGVSGIFPLFFPIIVTVLLITGYFKYGIENNWIDVAKKQDYIKNSPIWNKKRKARLKIDEYKCYSCNVAKKLEVHHITYKNLYNENLSDLVSLCRTCHQEIHNEYGYKYNSTFPPLRTYGGLDI